MTALPIWRSAALLAATAGGMDADHEPTGMYLRRVAASSAAERLTPNYFDSGALLHE